MFNISHTHMEYLNIPIAIFSSPEFAGAEPVQRSTWISLIGWCCKQENEGVIKDCRKWNMRLWMQTCGVMDSEVAEECDLFRFEGDDLHVFGYPHDIQKNLEVKRDIARTNGKLGGRPRKISVETYSDTVIETEMETSVGSEQKPTSVTKETHVGSNIETNVESVRKEGKERKEWNGNTPGGVSPARTGAKLSAGRKDGVGAGDGGASVPADVEEVQRYLRNEVVCGRLRLLPEDVESVAGKFFYNALKREWRDSRDIPIRNWRAAASQEALYHAERRSVGGAVPAGGNVDPYEGYKVLDGKAPQR